MHLQETIVGEILASNAAPDPSESLVQWAVEALATGQERVDVAAELVQMGIPKEQTLAILKAAAVRASENARSEQAAATAQPATGPVPVLQYQTPPRQDAGFRNRPARRTYRRDITVGAICIGIGVIIMALTYSTSGPSGGVYIICYGPIAFGLLRLSRGFIRKMTSPDGW
jgi:hypothetical protein